jgi:hypothetical protein
MSDIYKESQRVVDDAMDEARAMAPDCTCMAVDVEGASHLEWCPESTDTPTTRTPLPERVAS